MAKVFFHFQLLLDFPHYPIGCSLMNCIARVVVASVQVTKARWGSKSAMICTEYRLNIGKRLMHYAFPAFPHQRHNLRHAMTRILDLTPKSCRQLKQYEFHAKNPWRVIFLHAASPHKCGGRTMECRLG